MHGNAAMLTARAPSLLALGLLALLLAPGCNNDDDAFPRRAFSNAYDAVIAQGYTEGILVMAATFVLDRSDIPELRTRVSQNLAEVGCASVSEDDSAQVVVEFTGPCTIATRSWSGSLLIHRESDSAFSVTFDASVDERRIAGLLTIDRESQAATAAPRGTLRTTDLEIERIVDEYEAELQFKSGSVRADDGDSLDGYLLSGTTSWRNPDRNVWASVDDKNLVQAASNVPHSGVRLLTVDESVTFRALINAISANSTDLLLEGSEHSLRICVDENGAAGCRGG